MATSNGKRSNKIGRSSLSFFSFSALRFLVYCFCFALLLLSFFFFFIKLTFLFKTQFVGSLLRNTWQSIIVQWPNPTRLV